MGLLKKRKFWHRFIILKLKTRLNNLQFIYLMSILVGLAAGFASIILKNTVHFIQHLIHIVVAEDYYNVIFLAFPILGILIALLVIKYIIRRPVRDGIPSILYNISQNHAKINKHNMFSSVIASALTVSFGGSVGLEGPSVATGAAWGSNIGRFFRVNYKQTVLLIACASAAAISAIFKAPIAAIVFAIEVIMLDLTMASLVPLLLASSTGALLSYFMLGQDEIYSFTLLHEFELYDLHHYLILGVLLGLISLYFTRMYMFLINIFENKIKNTKLRLTIGGVSLGVLVFFMPSLYGEGFDTIMSSLKGDYSFLFDKSVFYGMKDNFAAVVILFIMVIFFKVFATSITLGIGGVGGIFAPSLFVGACTGLLYAVVSNHFGAALPLSNFALVGMAGLLAGLLHAPLTGIFLIAEITGGYGLFMPLIIVSTISYATIKYFEKNSVYTIQLAKRKQLLTHNKDKAVLTLMKVENLIENDFVPVLLNSNLRDIVKAVSHSQRNIFPIVDTQGYLKGIVRLDDIREIMFEQELWDTTQVSEIMVEPQAYVTPDDSMEDVAKKIQQTGRFNIAVLQDGKYLGFVSRANVFSTYRSMLKEFSDY